MRYSYAFWYWCQHSPNPELSGEYNGLDTVSKKALFWLGQACVIALFVLYVWNYEGLRLHCGSGRNGRHGDRNQAEGLVAAHRLARRAQLESLRLSNISYVEGLAVGSEAISVRNPPDYFQGSFLIAQVFQGFQTIRDGFLERESRWNRVGKFRFFDGSLKSWDSRNLRRSVDRIGNWKQLDLNIFCRSLSIVSNVGDYPNVPFSWLFDFHERAVSESKIDGSTLRISKLLPTLGIRAVGQYKRAYTDTRQYDSAQAVAVFARSDIL